MKTPMTQQKPRLMAQRISPARKNEPSSSTQRYQTPWTKVTSANSVVASNSIHFFGGEEPFFCQSKSSVRSTVNVTRYGRPSIIRSHTAPTSVANIKAANHASGRFNHGSADHPARVNIATTEKMTSDSVFQPVQR